MNDLEGTLAPFARFLDSERIPYMVIGGFANLKWGRPRLTQDLDVTVQVADEEVPAFLRRLPDVYKVLVPRPEEFVHDTRALPLRAPTGTRIDLIFAGLPFEDKAISRAVELDIEGYRVRVCTAEDLVVHKLASERARDREDVQGILLRQGKALDRSYLDPLVEQVASSLDRPEILQFYRDTLKFAESVRDPSNG